LHINTEKLFVFKGTFYELQMKFREL